MLLSSKKENKDHEIEILVDNSRTHSAGAYSLNDFRAGIDGNMMYHQLFSFVLFLSNRIHF
jgi:hypothetical protein